MNDLFAWIQACRAALGNQPQDDYLHLLSDRLPRLFRYHLAWCGDPLQAQALTEATTRLAIRWHTGYRGTDQEVQPVQVRGGINPAPTDTVDTWFFGLARYTRVYMPHRRVRSTPHQDAYSPTPLPGLAFVARLSTVFSHLPRRMAEALTLAFFGCLSQPEIGAVLKIKPDLVRRLLVDGLRRLQDSLASTPDHPAPEPLQGQAVAALETIFDAGSETIQPDPAWLREVRERTIPSSPDKLANLPAWLPGPAFRRIFGLRAAASWGLRLAPALLILAIIFVWWSNGQPLSNASKFTPAPVILAAGTGQPTRTLTMGPLVPPPESVCESWQAAFSAGSSAQANLKMDVSFNDPTADSTLPEGKGTACQVELLGSGLDFPNPDARLTAALQTLTAKGFKENQTYQCDSCRPDNAMFGDYWVGNGYSLKNGSVSALLSLAWRPAVAEDCPVGVACNPAPDQRQYALRLLLASGDAQTTLDSFISSWTRGDNQALKSLSAGMQKNTASITDLDHLAGFQRTMQDRLSFTWNVTKNNGNQVVTTIFGKINGGSFSFISQLELSIVSGQWKVSRLAPGILFQPSEDIVYFAGQDGVVYRVSLAKQSLDVIASAGVYYPKGSTSSTIPIDPPVISPDGQWLTLHEYRATVFINLLHPGLVERLAYPVRLAWSPDGARLAYYRLDNPREVYLLSGSFASPAVQLASFSEDLACLAFSPDGSQLAALTVRPSIHLSSADPSAPAFIQTGPSLIEQRGLYTVDPSTGKIKELANLKSSDPLYSNPSDLTWTDDGQEIWYGSLQTAVNAQNGNIRPHLVSNPAAPVPPEVQASLLLPSVMPSNQSPLQYNAARQILISPDGQYIAPNLNELTMPIDISLAPVGDISHILWSVKLDHLGSIAWTQDSQSLIAGGPPDQPATIYRLDATSGQNQELAKDVYWIGVGSDLKSRSLALAPHVKTGLLTLDDSADWPCQTFALGVSCLRLPPGWATAIVTQDQVYTLQRVVTNIAFPPGIGWTSQGDGTVYIQIYTAPWFGGDTEATFFNGYPLATQGSDWESITDWGVKGVHIFARNNPTGEEEVIFPRAGGRLIFVISPPSAYGDPVVQKIIQSLQFDPEG